VSKLLVAAAHRRQAAFGSRTKPVWLPDIHTPCPARQVSASAGYGRRHSRAEGVEATFDVVEVVL